jgi:hypothetical protein
VTDDQVAARPRKVTPARAAGILAERDPVIARLVAEAGLHPACQAQRNCSITLT